MYSIIKHSHYFLYNMVFYSINATTNHSTLQIPFQQFGPAAGRILITSKRGGEKTLGIVVGKEIHLQILTRCTRGSKLNEGRNARSEGVRFADISSRHNIFQGVNHLLGGLLSPQASRSDRRPDPCAEQLGNRF